MSACFAPRTTLIRNLYSPIRRTIRAVRLLARDGELPRWLRGLAAVGVAPIPGPFDEAVLLVVAAILWFGYRERLHAAWRTAGEQSVRDDL